MGIGSGQSLERTQALDFGTILAQALKKFIGIFTLREWLVTHTQTLPVLLEIHCRLVRHPRGRLRTLQKNLSKVDMLIVDELGYVPFTAVGSELLFEVLSRRYEQGSTMLTSNLPFDEWTSVFGSERLTGALLDRLTHHVHILEMNGDSYRLASSQKRARTRGALAQPEPNIHADKPQEGGATSED